MKILKTVAVHSRLKTTATMLAIMAALLADLGSNAQAQSSTNPMGYIQITALGNSDTHFSAPLQRPSAFQGAVSAVSGSTVTVQGTPGWTANQFQYVAASQVG